MKRRSREDRLHFLSLRIFIHTLLFIIRMLKPFRLAHNEEARGQLHPRRRVLQSPSIVLRQTPAARHPDEGPINDPATMENREPFEILGFVDDFKIRSKPEILELRRRLRSLISDVRL